MSSLVYHSGTRGINFHTRQWFGVPKAFTALLFKPLLSHTITIPNSLAGNQPTVFTTLVSQSFISPVLLYMSLMLVNDVNFLVLKSPIMLLIVPGFYVTDRHYVHQDISSIKSDVNRISQRDWRQKKPPKNQQPHHTVSSQTVSLVCSLQVIKLWCRNLCICFTGTWAGFFPADLN